MNNISKISIISILLSINILGYENNLNQEVMNSGWKEKEVLASDVNAPAEMLLKLEKDTNPFIKRSLKLNPKYQKLKQDNNLYSKIKSGNKLLNKNISNISKKFEYINDNLKTIMFVYRNSIKKENELKHGIELKLGKLTSQTETEYAKKISLINNKYFLEIQKYKNKIKKLNKKLNDYNEQFEEQLSSELILENKKSLLEISKFNNEYDVIEDKIIKTSNYLDSINSSMFTILNDGNIYETSKTINPEAIALRKKYHDMLSEVEPTIHSVFKTKKVLLYTLSQKKLMEAKKERLLKILKVNKELMDEKIKKESEMKIKKILMEKEILLAKNNLDYNKRSNLLKIEINQVKLDIKNTLSIFNTIGKDNKFLSSLINNFNNLLYSFQISDKLLMHKKYYSASETDLFKKDKARILKIASNKYTPIETLIELSNSEYWQVREAISKNTRTPQSVIKKLTKDNNKFVALSAKKHLK